MNVSVDIRMGDDYLDSYIEQEPSLLTTVDCDDAVVAFLDKHVGPGHTTLTFDTLYQFTIPDEQYRVHNSEVDGMLNAMGVRRYVCVNWDTMLLKNGIDVLEVWGKQIVVRRRIGLLRPDSRCNELLSKLRWEFRQAYTKFLKIKGVQVR